MSAAPSTVSTVASPEPVGSAWHALYLAAATRLADALRLRNPDAVRQRAIGVLQVRDLAERAGRLDEIEGIWLSPPHTCGGPEAEAYLASLAAIPLSEEAAS